MAFIFGIVLVALTATMVLVARPVAGELAQFLRVWFVGQAYVLGALASALAGITVMINTWPF
jgi:hypothetical protein